MRIMSAILYAILGGMLCLVMLVGCSQPDHEQAPARAAQGEELLAQAPDGWQQGFVTKTDTLRIANFIPNGSSMEDWREKVTFESLSGDPLPDPIEFVEGIGDHQRANCEKFDQFNIQSGLENNYPTSVRLLTCSRNKLTDMSRVTLIKAIQGNEHFYVVTRTKRQPVMDDDTAPISDAEMATWASYARGISVCDSNRPEHECPAIEPPPT
jgi:hypothetical protein